MDARRLILMILMIVSGTTLIGSILGAVLELSFGWWLAVVVCAVAVGMGALYFMHKFPEKG